MIRVMVFGSLAAAAFLIGFFRVSASDLPAAREADAWVPVTARIAQRRADALPAMAEVGRWQIELDMAGEVQVSGRFDSDYRVIALVDTGTPYALLEKTNSVESEADTMLKVYVDDVLEDGWIITLIEDAAVSAQREEELQRVELFPQT